MWRNKKLLKEIEDEALFCCGQSSRLFLKNVHKLLSLSTFIRSSWYDTSTVYLKMKPVFPIEENRLEFNT